MASQAYLNALMTQQRQLAEQAAQQAQAGQDGDAAGFDPKFYAASNPDIANSGMDPLTHYLTFGKKEGRAANAEELAAGKTDTLAKAQANSDAGVMPRLDPTNPASWASLFQRGNDATTAFNQQPRVLNLGMGAPR